jgi:hypothetical protein
MMNLDLFADEPAPMPDAFPAPQAPGAGRGLPDFDADKVLVQLFVSADRKNALKLLAPQLRSDLAAAVELVARERSAAQARASAGEVPDAFGWIVRMPDLARAIAALHEHRLDTREIPMPASH